MERGATRHFGTSETNGGLRFAHPPYRFGRKPMSRLEDYANKYQTVRFERRDGICR